MLFIENQMVLFAEVVSVVVFVVGVWFLAMNHLAVAVVVVVVVGAALMFVIHSSDPLIHLYSRSFVRSAFVLDLA